MKNGQRIDNLLADVRGTALTRIRNLTDDASVEVMATSSILADVALVLSQVKQAEVIAARAAHNISLLLDSM